MEKNELEQVLVNKRLKIKELKKISVRKDRDIVRIEDESERVQGQMDVVRAESLG